MLTKLFGNWLRRPVWVRAGAVVLGVVLVGALLIAAGPTRRTPAPQENVEVKSPQHAVTTLNDQTDLAVTVYNSNIALIPTCGNFLCLRDCFTLSSKTSPRR